MAIFTYFTYFHYNIYRVNQQCCPGRNCLETPRRPFEGGLGGVSGGSPDILSKSLANPDKILIFFSFFLNILSGFARGVSGQFSPGQHCWFTWYLFLNISLVTQPMLQRRQNCTELRSMDSYIQILCIFLKSKPKVPPPSLPCTRKSPFIYGIYF